MYYPGERLYLVTGRDNNNIKISNEVWAVSVEHAKAVFCLATALEFKNIESVEEDQSNTQPE